MPNKYLDITGLTYFLSKLRLTFAAVSHSHSADSISDGTANKAYTAAEKTKLAAISGTNTGNETTTSEGAIINSATAKTTPVDADMLGLMDSAASNVLKKLSWANIKTTLKSYFDTYYALTSHTQAASTISAGTLAGQVNANASASSTLTTAQVRDVIISTTDLTAGSSSLTTGTIYFVYE